MIMGIPAQTTFSEPFTTSPTTTGPQPRPRTDEDPTIRHD
jgi:hypothetical protein